VGRHPSFPFFEQGEAVLFCCKNKGLYLSLPSLPFFSVSAKAWFSRQPDFSPFPSLPIVLDAEKELFFPRSPCHSVETAFFFLFLGGSVQRRSPPSTKRIFSFFIRLGDSLSIFSPVLPPRSRSAPFPFPWREMASAPDDSLLEISYSPPPPSIRARISSPFSR